MTSSFFLQTDKYKRRVRGSWLKGQDLPTEGAHFSQSTGVVVEKLLALLLAAPNLECQSSTKWVQGVFIRLQYT